MPDRNDFIRAICENPSDTDLRLVFADWLDENGEEEYSEFIRVQCELARLTRWGETEAGQDDGCPQCQRIQSMRKRERELESIDRRAWMGAAVCVVPDGACFSDHLTFRRGFVETIRCTAADWIAHADAVTACQPVREVSLMTRPPQTWHQDINLELDARVSPDGLPLLPLPMTAPAELAHLEYRWPGIKFALPRAVFYRRAGETVLLDEIRNQRQGQLLVLPEGWEATGSDQDSTG